MKHLLFLLGTMLVLGIAPLIAAPATPAQPVDPDQARPARPVTMPDSITPDMVVPVMPPSTPTPSSPSDSASPAPAASAPAAPKASGPALSILADSSLKQVLQELAQSWADSQDNSPQVPLTLTNAGTLRSKAESTAVDVVIGADVDDMKELTSQGVLVDDGQRTVARNTVVVYGRKALVKDDELDWFDLVGSEWKKVALGNPDLVASGRVAQRALLKHSLMDEETKSLYVFAVNESQSLAIAEREQADAVFVYKTDVGKVKLRGFDVFPMSTTDAPPVFYIAAVSRHSANPVLAQAFVDFCGSETAKTIWVKYGFETN